MTAHIRKLSAVETWDLIFNPYMARLSPVDQETMQRTMRNSSHIWVGDNEGVILATWGLIPPTLLSDRAYLWLFTTEHLATHQFMFIRHSQRVIQEALAEYPIICGNTLRDNCKAIRWLRWLGAEFTEIPNSPTLAFEIKTPWQPQLAQSA